MKCLLVMCSLLIAGLFPALEAQDKKSDTGLMQVTGCLAQGHSANEYTIKDANGKSYELRGDSQVNLKAHVGHKVTVSGTQTSDKGRGDDASRKAGDDVHLMVTDLKMVSVTCS